MTTLSAPEIQVIHSNIRTAAIKYARLGMEVVILHGIIDEEVEPWCDCIGSTSWRLVCDCRKGARCRSAGKHPQCGKTGAWQITSDVDEVKRLWDKHPTSNVGLVMGNGLITIDLDLARDDKPSGLDTWARLQEINGQVPETMTVRTGSEGRHLYFREPPDHRSGNWLPGIPPSQGVDVRGTGGQGVAPPSLHKTGNLYEVTLDVEPARAPDWFYEQPCTGNEKPRKSRKQIPHHPTLQTRTAIQSRFTPELIEQKIAELNEIIDQDAELPEATLKLLRRGRSGDQSRLIQAITLSAANVALDPELLFSMLECPGNIAGKGLRRRIKERGRKAAIEWMDLNWHKAQWLRAQSLLGIEEMRGDIERYEWTDVEYLHKGKRELATARAMVPVLGASLDLAEKYTTLDPMLSKMMLSDATTLSLPTVRKGLRGLAHLGWLKEKDKSYGAYIYSFLDPSERKNTPLADVLDR